MKIHQAFILAAGLGTRMGKATQKKPKPLLQIGGVAMIDYIINILQCYGCERIIVNIHAHAGLMQKYLQTNHPFVFISDESKTLMGTGGALIYAYNQSLIQDKPFFVHNCDTLFPGTIQQKKIIFEEVSKAFNPEYMDGLLLLKKTQLEKGDFSLGKNNLIKAGNEYIYTGVQILSPTILKDVPINFLDMKKIWEKTIAQKHLYGFILNQDWFHAGTKTDFTYVKKNFSRIV